MKLVMHCNSSVLLFQYLTAKFNFYHISSQCLGLRSVVILFVSLVPKKVVYLPQVLSDTFCPLCEYSKHMLTAAGVWTDCRLETNQFYWARQSGADERQHAMNN